MVCILKIQDSFIEAGQRNYWKYCLIPSRKFVVATDARINPITLLMMFAPPSPISFETLEAPHIKRYAIPRTASMSRITTACCGIECLLFSVRSTTAIISNRVICYLIQTSTIIWIRNIVRWVFIYNYSTF